MAHKVKVAAKAGFCFGVANAIRKLDEAIKSGRKPIVTLGHIIHNRQVIERYEALGIEVLEEAAEAPEGAVVVIRSHGIAKNVYDVLKQKHIEIIDATCPDVKKVQDIVYEHYKAGYHIIIVGDKSHPEVIGINGWCENSAQIINCKKDVPNFKKCGRICVVAQTTMIERAFLEIVEAFADQDGIKVFNTICSATAQRQEKAAEVAKVSDAMVVIGGYHSSNTKKLADICGLYCEKTFHIETADELDMDQLNECEKVGITAGASTPAWIIEEVAQKL